MKNYTSTVDANTTIYRIEQILVRFGASNISKDYTAGEVTGISFSINAGADMPMLIRLPANVEAVAEYFFKSSKKPVNKDKVPAWKERIAEQAKRTAWKLVQDWIEVQLSLVEMKQAEAAQVFLPYAWDGKVTLFQMLKEKRFPALGYKPRDVEATAP